VLEAGRRSSWNEIEERLEVAVGAEGKVGNLMSFNLRADIGAVGLQHRRRRGHHNGFGDAARLERDIDAG